MTPSKPARRRFCARILAASSTLLLTGCDRLSQSKWFPKMLAQEEQLSAGAQHFVTARASLAQEFTVADLSPEFRSNGTANPNNPHYQALAANGFVDYRLQITGLVEHPAALSLSELRALASRTQITRHDCVEGWSAIGKWKGTQLSALLDVVRPQSNARYVVFFCADPMSDGGTQYYESIDLDDAYHLQTILAYELNDHDLPIRNGAPLRLRVERQLGYKMAKYIMGIELVEDFVHIGDGKGGYWEDRGYEWYAGI